MIGYPYCGESGGDGSGGDDGGAGTDPVGPGGGGGGAGRTPKAPTVSQCAAAAFQCLNKVENKLEDCMTTQLAKARDRVDAGFPCFGVPADDIWNTREVRIGAAVISCNDISTFEKSNIGRLCTNEFRRRAMKMCRNGNSERSETNGSEDGFSVGYEAKNGFKAGWASKTHLEVTQTITANKGYGDACYTAREKGIDQCKTAGDECLKNALDAAGTSGDDTQSMQFVFAQDVAPGLADMAFEDQLLSRIDRVLLGLKKESSGSGLSELKDRHMEKAPGSQQSMFHPIKRRQQESSYWYRERLEFLVNWGDFVKRHSLSKVTQTDMQNAFVSAQRAFVDEWEFEGDLISMRFVTDALTGADGLGDSVEIYDSYLGRGGSAAKIANAERKLRGAAEELLTEQEFSDFIDGVWKDVPHIGLSGPMNLARQVNKTADSAGGSGVRDHRGDPNPREFERPEGSVVENEVVIARRGSDDSVNKSAELATQCSRASKTLCKSEGATCDVIRGTDGSSSELCRWASISTEAACAKTPGLWTSVRSRYARNHPDALPPGKSGACISEAANLQRNQ